MTQPPHPPSVDPTPGPAASEGSGPRTRALPVAVEPPGSEPVEATREVEKALPFDLLGFDTDNGSEFLNWHFLRYFQDRPKAVGFTRSRPLQEG